jgi:flagellar biosynthetic protein FliR
VITVTTAQLEAWLGAFFWPFVRIGACLMVAPLFGARPVPPRVRLVLAAAITLLIAPLVSSPVNVTPFSIGGMIVTMQQVLIGVAVGFALQLIFDAVTLGGQLLANSMGLSFAFNVDPLRGTSTPALGQFYTILVTLTFLALNGHLALIETLTAGFRTLPVGTSGLGSGGLWSLVTWGGQLFAGALSVALPGMAALLIVNLGFGVMSRAAPTLNLFAVGFPVALVFGLVILLAGLPVMQSSFIELLALSRGLTRSLLGLGG